MCKCTYVCSHVETRGQSHLPCPRCHSCILNQGPSVAWSLLSRTGWLASASVTTVTIPWSYYEELICIGLMIILDINFVSQMCSSKHVLYTKHKAVFQRRDLSPKRIYNQKSKENLWLVKEICLLEMLRSIIKLLQFLIFHSFIQQLHGFCQLNTKTVLGTGVENTTMEKIGSLSLFSVHKCSKMMSPSHANEQA